MAALASPPGVGRRLYQIVDAKTTRRAGRLFAPTCREASWSTAGREEGSDGGRNRPRGRRGARGAQEPRRQDQRPQRLPRTRRRHRHEHAAHAGFRAPSDRRCDLRFGRGGGQGRGAGRAHGSQGELGRDPVADDPGRLRRPRHADEPDGRGGRRRTRGRDREGLRLRAGTGRGHDAYRRQGRGQGGPRGPRGCGPGRCPGGRGSRSPRLGKADPRTPRHAARCRGRRRRRARGSRDLGRAVRLGHGR